MYLKEIKAYGFKSFADKINIELSKDINAIVGPNGSGKSNVVDAVRWVLGEQSIKALRGDNSTDIIFSGSKNRKPLNSASVTLVFDNSDHHLPLLFDEVSVKRVIFRSGENEYYLNNERCRLKDINDVFMDSGAGKESFNVISQGKIDEILSTKAVDRRVIFEEAAGVLKYKKRKEDAIKRLDKTNINLNRVSDIIGELERTIDPLRIESEKALKYRECKDKLANTEISLMVSDIDKLNYEYNSLKGDIERLNDEIIELSSNSGSYDIDIMKNKDILKKNEEDIFNKQNGLLELSKKAEKLEGDLRLFDERSKDSDNSDIERRVGELREKILVISNSIRDMDNGLFVNREKVKGEEDSNKAIVDEYNKKCKERDRICDSISKGERDIMDLEYKISFLEEKINSGTNIPKSVRMVLNNKRFKGVYDIIGNVLSMDKEYSTMVNTSLGSSSNGLIVDNKESTYSIISYLKENNLGRITFYPLSSVKERFIDKASLSAIENIEGYIGILADLVSYDPKFRVVVLRELGNVIGAKDFESASRISEATHYKYKVVTLDGQVINAGGTIVGGSQIRSSNMSAITSEIEGYNRDMASIKRRLEEYREGLRSVNREIEVKTGKISEARLDIKRLNDIIGVDEERRGNILRDRDNLERELKDLEATYMGKTDDERDSIVKCIYDTKNEISDISKEITVLRNDNENIKKFISELETLASTNRGNVARKEKEKKGKEINYSKIEVRLDNLLLNLTSEYNLTFEGAKDKYTLYMEEEDARRVVNELKTEIKMLGDVNMNAPSEYSKASERYEFLSKQRDDLLKAEDTLLSIIEETDGIMKERFLETFNKTRGEFQRIFKELFRGGSADIRMVDPEDLLNTGIEIYAEPPGKKLQNISLLSGGEKTFTAISLLFAILSVRPVPFCLLDEIEAALDEANVNSFGEYLSKFRDKTQFILITHKKKTMEFADTLYGITMKEAGISKLVSVRLEDIKV